MSVRVSKCIVFVIAVLMALQLLLSCAKEAEEKAPGEVAWITSYEEAVQSAGKKKLPVMIDFYTDWCGYCKKLDNETYVNGDVVAKAKGFVSLKINADVEQDLAGRYNIRFFPTILFVDQAGNEIHRVVGFRMPADFVGEMDVALAAFKGRAGS
jgi:thiol:disulfide interchange protein